MYKIIPLLLGLFLMFNTAFIAVGSQDEYGVKPDLLVGSQTAIIDDSKLIENYTWAVMRYDHGVPSENFEIIQIPRPSVGPILIPSNMMAAEVCRAAVSVYSKSKMDTLEALSKYDSERMIHTSNAFFRGKDEWNTESCFNFRKESAVEMDTLGEICLRGDLVGECYAQASFNTAVLRLCGFPPEEVFTISIQCYQGGHAINVIKVEDQWYAFDSTYAQYVRMGMRDGLIFEVYFSAPLTDYITALENDKYLINFGTLYPQYIPTAADPYMNMNSETLIEIIENIRPLFNNSFLGRNKWNINSFIENATPNPWMETIAVPYTVEDAEGSTLEEKAESLASLNKKFILTQVDNESLNQYDKSLYALGLLSVDYPQAYANAAKLAAWTSWYGMERDMQIPFFDVFMTSFWIRTTILNKRIVPEDCVAYSDLLYLRHAGSSVDKAVLAYGTLRNMKKDNDFWPADDLYVLITDDYHGYLASNLNDEWKYLSFEQGSLISNNIPENIEMVFNEVEYLDSWGK